MTEKLKLFYTRQNRDMVECCIVFEGEFYSISIPWSDAFNMGVDMINNAQAARWEEKHELANSQKDDR